MSASLQIPLLKDIVPSGIPYGSTLLVEFEPDSLWYETSLTMASLAMRDGVGTEYHTFQHFPEEVKQNLAGFGLDMRTAEDADSFRLIDSYTVTTGLEGLLGTKRKRPAAQSESLKVSDWSISITQTLKAGIQAADMRRLHIDDNTSILGRYNQENAITDYWRTRTIPYSRKLKLIYVHSLLKGVHSDGFYKQFESLADGIIDLAPRQDGGSTEVEQYARVRLLRGQQYDSKWRRLRLLPSGEVRLD